MLTGNIQPAYYVFYTMPRKMPLVTLSIVLANVLAYLLELVDGEAVCDAYGLVPAAFMASGDVAPLFSSMFLHDPATFVHLGGNMAFLVVFGTIVEGQLGHLRFAGLYAAAGVMGGLVHILVDPEATMPLVGASGAVFGVLAVAGVLRPRLLGFVVAFAGVEIWRAFSGDDTGISFGAHLGGLAAGTVVASILRALDDGALEAA